MTGRSLKRCGMRLRPYAVDSVFHSSSTPNNREQGMRRPAAHHCTDKFRPSSSNFSSPPLISKGVKCLSDRKHFFRHFGASTQLYSLVCSFIHVGVGPGSPQSSICISYLPGMGMRDPHLGNRHPEVLVRSSITGSNCILPFFPFLSLFT